MLITQVVKGEKTSLIWRKALSVNILQLILNSLVQNPME